MKRIILTLFLLLNVILPLQVKALSLSENNITIDKGNSKTVDLYANVESEITEVSFSLVYTSYDVPAYFNIESGLRDEAVGIKHKIVFSVPVTGKIKLGTVRVEVVANPKITAGSVNIHSATAKTSDGTVINLNTQMINATVGEGADTTVTPEPEVTEPTTTTEPEVNDDEVVEVNMLSKIESEIVDIKLKKDVFEYSIKVKEDIEELDLKPIVVDEKYQVEISSQKIDELTDGQIIITVKDGEKTEEYKINVKVIKDIDTEVDEGEFESTNSYKGKWTVLIIIFVGVLFAGLFFIKKQ